MFYRLYMGLHMTAGISWLSQKLSLLRALKVHWPRQFFNTLVQEYQDATGQTVRRFGENEDPGMVSRGNCVESYCGEAAAKRKGRAEGDRRQQGSAGAGHAAAGQEAKRASQDLKFRTGEPASAVPDRPSV